MKFKKILLFAYSLALLFVSTSHSKTATNQQRWVESCPNKQLCFKHPDNLMPVNVQIIDSNAGQLHSDNLTLTYDLGWYASQFNEMTSATVEPIIIDGRCANILFQDNRMALSVAKVSGKVRFSMLLEFKGTPDFAHGRKIFNSITFAAK